MKRRASLLAAVVVLSAVVPFAVVGTSVAAGGSCSPVTAPVEITDPGCYALSGDLTDSGASSAVTITASDVVFDGMDHTLDSDRTSRYGIRVGSTGDVTNVTIRNVTLTDFHTAISLENTTESEIRDTHVTVNTDIGNGVPWAVKLAESSDNTIANNTLLGTDSVRIGQQYTLESPRNVVTNNTIEGEVSIRSNDTIVRNNDISASTEYGISVTGFSTTVSDGTVIENNAITSNSRSGIYLSGTNGTSLVGNELRGNREGIATEGETTNTVITDTISVGNSVDISADNSVGFPEPITARNLDVGTATFSAVTLSDIDLSGTTLASPPSSVGSLGINFTATDIHVDQYSEPDGYLDVDLQYTDADVVTLDESTVALLRYDEQSDSWVDEGATVDTATNTVSANLTSLDTDSGSIFTVTADESPPGPELAVSPESVAFGTVDVGSSADETVTVSNTGDEDLQVNDVSLTGIDAGEFRESEDGFTLTPGDTRDVTVSFSPTFDGTKTADLVVESDDPDTPTVSVALTGTGESDAGTDVTGCRVIDSAGVYQVRNEISDATAQHCFEITASDVVLDGNNLQINGVNAADSSAVFVNGTAGALTNVTVKDVYASQFSRGLTATNAAVEARGLYGLPDTGVWTYGADLTLEQSTFDAGAGVVAEPWNGRVSNVALEEVSIDSFRGAYADEGTLSIGNSTLRQADVVDDGIVLWNATLDLSNTIIESSTDRMGVGVLAQNNSTVHASHSTFTNNSEGVQLVDSEGTITHSTIENPGKNGLNYTRSTGVASFNTITNSSRADNYGWAGGIYAFESDVTASDNTVVGGGEDGILLHHSEGLVHNNTVRDTSGWEVSITSSDADVTNNTVEGALVVFGNTYTTDGEPTARANVTHNAVVGDGTGSWGILVDANAYALVEHNDVTSNQGIYVNRGAGADVRHNVVRSPDRSHSYSGVTIEDTQAHPDLEPARPITVIGNEIDARHGVYVTEDAMTSQLEIHLNDLSATDVALQNNNASSAVLFTTLNYYGPRGPTDDRVVGNWENLEPFLTDASGIDEFLTTENTQSFGFDLEFEAGKQYAFGTPGRLSANLSTVFDDFDGAVYLYDSTTDSWTLATGDEVLGPMDAVAVVPTTDTRAVVDFADATPARATSRHLDTTGWHFVAPRMHTDAEEAFSTRTVGVTDLLDTFEEPEDPELGSMADSFGRYTFSPDRTSQGDGAPTVNPFTGYFVYVDDPGTIPGAVPDGVGISEFGDLLTGGR
ncbi:right-handed parallel beta-helix repeat-containing protein [Halomontanus rarus]|uniref:right-handed parallel beta-helix repeat-containing protein n=1 Tax=Halomontanus rarus TaxID=3034020 RepID=UPI0023E8F8F3|nr:right-handed parallel beta-helix repeat-containing protein [Halovivax sp. TS33]